MPFRTLRSLVPIALLVSLVALAPSTAQQWLPAGQMVGPLMWQFPLSLPDGTHLIGLRWVNEKNNDSLYWFDIRSFMTEPRMYERQLPLIKTINVIGDFDSDGLTDVWGGTYQNRGLSVFGAFTDEERLVPHEAGMLYADPYAETRYFGDINGDGLNDDFATGRDSEGFARIVYGDRDHPFHGPSYVALHDNSDPQYPDLKPTIVAALGMMGGKPCVVQSYQTMPETSPIYELHELNMEDLQSRAPSIRTTLLQQINVGENIRYGYVVLRTPDVWWLFDPRGASAGGKGLKVTRQGITIESVPEFWHGYWEQYFGQGGEDVDYNFPRVMDSDRPFVRQDFQIESVEGVGDVPVASFAYARVSDPFTASVEMLGHARVPLSQRKSSSLGYVAVVPDIDLDGIADVMVNNMFTEIGSSDRNRAVSLYLTSHRPTVSVPEGGAQDTTTIAVIDEGTQWRLMSAASCAATPPEVLGLYDVTGSLVAQADLRPEGLDILLVKPAGLPPVALWVRIGQCGVRVQ